MSVHPAIDENWPTLAALVRTLDALDGRTITVARESKGDTTALAREVARELSKPGGPQIARRAIANR